ncbi:MAG: hypothetical protein IPJ84_10260 [Bdellovibrionales bacterium]|nr:hypothetical protein [Bdellovibrionales bacterium]
MTLDNREISFVCWLLLLGFFASLEPKVRKAFSKFFKALFQPNLLVILSAFTIYISLEIFILSAIGFWSVSFLKETLLWIFLSATALLFDLNKKLDSQSNIFGTIAKDQFKLSVVIEFLAGIGVGPLWLELLLVPFGAILGGMLAFSQKPEYTILRQPLNFVLALLGIWILATAGLKISEAPTEFFSVETLRLISLPLVLTFFLFPILYATALLFIYEQLFARANARFKDNRELRIFLKRESLKTGALRLRRSYLVMRYLSAGMWSSESVEDIQGLLDQAKKHGAKKFDFEDVIYPNSDAETH